MLILKTEHGNFGNIKDIYKFMIEEDLKEIVVTGEYVGTKFCNTKLTLQDIEKLNSI